MTLIEHARVLEEKIQDLDVAIRKHVGVLMQMDAEGTLPNAVAIRQSVGKILDALGVVQ